MSSVKGSGVKLWALLIVALMLSGALGFGGGFRYAGATLPTQDGTWGQWLRDAYVYVTSALHLNYGTAGNLLYLDGGKNVTSSTIGVGTGNDLLGVDDLTVANLTLTGPLDGNGWDITGVDDLNVTDVFTSGDLWVHNGTAYTNVTDTLIYPESEASYIIWTDGASPATYYAKNGHTGQIDFSGTDAVTVIQAAQNTLTNGGRIHLKSPGLYVFTDTLVLNNSCVTLSGENPWTGTSSSLSMLSGIKLGDNVNKNIISVTGVKCVIENLCIWGNKANNVIGYGILTAGGASRDLHLNKVYVLYSPESGILHQGGNSAFHAVYVEYSGKEGWRVSGQQNTFIDCSSWNDARYGFSITPTSVKNTFIGCRVYGVTGTYSGVVLQGTDNSFVDGQVWENQQRGIWILGAIRAIVTGNHVIDNSIVGANTYSGIHIGDNTVKSIINGNIVSGTHKYSIEESATGTSNNQIQNNFVETAVTSQISYSSAKVSGNIGFITESSGTASILNTTTSIVINHGLSYTPTTANTAWSITPLELSTNDPGQFYIDTFTATQATIRCRNNPGASNLDLQWSATRKP